MTDPTQNPPPADPPRTMTFRDASAPVQNGAAPLPAPKLQNKGRTVSPEEAAQIQARRTEIRNRHRGENGQFAKEAEQPTPPAPREPVETIELTLPNGRAVKYGPPADVALTFRVIDICGDDNGAAKVAVVRSLLCIREIDGKPVPAIANMVDAQKLANMVGDDGLDVLYLLHNTTWPPLTLRDLPTIKKNHKQP
jgi:hypothetical protein